MARMVATKAALSIRVDALSDADSKSSADSAFIGIENRAKLESRLRALEYRNDLTTTTPFKGEKKREQPRFEMKTDVKQYNTAADAVGFLPTQRQGAEALAINAVLDVKEEKRREKEEKRRAKEEKQKRKAAAAAAAAAIEEEHASEPKDGTSFACDPFGTPYLLIGCYFSANGDGRGTERAQEIEEGEEEGRGCCCGQCSHCRCYIVHPRRTRRRF